MTYIFWASCIQVGKPYCTIIHNLCGLVLLIPSQQKLQLTTPYDRIKAKNSPQAPKVLHDILYV